MLPGKTTPYPSGYQPSVVSSRFLLGLCSVFCSPHILSKPFCSQNVPAADARTSWTRRRPPLTGSGQRVRRRPLARAGIGTGAPGLPPPPDPPSPPEEGWDHAAAPPLGYLGLGQASPIASLRVPRRRGK